MGDEIGEVPVNSVGKIEKSLVSNEMKESEPKKEASSIVARNSRPRRRPIDGAGFRYMKTGGRSVDRVKKPTPKPVIRSIAEEESYLQTIASLDSSLVNKKDVIFRPDERIAFERDMAITTSTIARLKKSIKKNPKNQLAKDLLKTSYQNKIDLMNSVVRRDELVASMQ